MRSIVRRLKKLEDVAAPVERPLSRKERYEKVQQETLKRLSPEDRSQWQEWASVFTENGEPSEAQEKAHDRWADMFYLVAEEIPGPKITAYDGWI